MSDNLVHTSNQSDALPDETNDSYRYAYRELNASYSRVKVQHLNHCATDAPYMSTVSE